MTRDKAIELARAATVRSSAADWEPNPAFTDPLVDVLEGLGLLKFDEPEPTPATHWVPIAGTMTMGVADGDHKVRRIKQTGRIVAIEVIAYSDEDEEE